jgi:hypothetical protein
MRVAFGCSSSFLALCVLCVLFCCCVSCNQEERRINFQLNTPLRVAVLPFEDSSSGDSLISKPFATGIDYVPLIGGSEKRLPATLMRETFTTNLKATSLDPVLNSFVDHVLTTNNLYDIQKLRSVSLKRLEELLSVDAVLFGDVTHWDRSYYGLESSVTVGLKIKMLDVSNGEVLWEHQYSDTERRGLSKGPTGYVSAGLEPLRGLSSTLLVEQSNEVCRHIVESIQPEKLALSAEGALPRILNAAFQYDSKTRELTVIAIGDAGKRGTFSIGNRWQDIPLREVAEGQYIGSFHFGGSDFFEEKNPDWIEIRFLSSTGKRSTFVISSPHVLSARLSTSDVVFLLNQTNPSYE